MQFVFLVYFYVEYIPILLSIYECTFTTEFITSVYLSYSSFYFRIDTNLQLLQQRQPEKSVKYSPFDYYNYHFHVCSTNNHVVYKMINYEMKEGYFRPFFLLCTSTIKLITSSVNSTSLS